MNRRRNGARGMTPPYGPTSGMLQGLTLLQKANISRVDEELLREHDVAPGNEYKVIGALRFLALLDDEGRPTDRSRQLRTRGETFSLALQGIIHEAYGSLFESLDLRRASKDEVYNYFVTQAGLGMEMAQKATRFLVGLCQMAGLELSPMLEASVRRKSAAAARSRAAGRSTRTAPPAAAQPRQSGASAPESAGTRNSPHAALLTGDSWSSALPSMGGGMPVILALTPQTAELSEDDLARFFRKMFSAYRRAQFEAG